MTIAVKKVPVIGKMITKADQAMRLRLKNRFKVDDAPRKTPIPKILDDVQSETFKARLSRHLVDGQITEKAFRNSLKGFAKASKDAKTMEKFSAEIGFSDRFKMLR